MAHEGTFREVFRAKKRHKEAFEVPRVCFNVLPEAFRQYSEKVTFKLSVTLEMQSLDYGNLCGKHSFTFWLWRGFYESN